MSNTNDLLNRINNCYSSMSKGQKLLATYITDNYDKAVFLTAAKMGETVGVSESTVVRFATYLGYKGYPEFQRALEELVRNKLNSVQRMEVTYGRISQSKILETVLSADADKIKTTLEKIDHSAFEVAVSTILEAKNIYIVGIRSCAPLASFLGFYLNLMFDISDITEEELPYLGVLKAVLGYMDTEHYNYADLANEINLMTGGISSQINIYADTKKKDSFHAKYEVRSKILYQNLEEGLRLLSEILMGTQITDEKRLYEILARIKSRLQMSLSSAGHSVSAMRAMSYFSPVARFNDLVGGIALYRTIAELEEHFEEKKQFLMDKLRSLTEKIFVKNRLLISLTADAEGYQLLEEKFPQFLTVLPDGEKEGEAVTFHCEKKNEGFLDASKVQYVSRAGNYLSKGYSYTGALRILKVILSYDYLWINVRVKGGAYGCMSGFMRNGDAYFTSYRDPNLKSTNEIYEGIPAYLRAFDADERDMTKYIIGTVSDMDTPLNPAAKGMRSVSAYLTNISYEELQRERNEVLDAQPENIKNLAVLIEAVLAQDALCVIGAEENVEAEKDMFLEVKNLY